MGSTATSTCGPRPLPTFSPLNNHGALSFSPSPITTTPEISTELKIKRIAFTAASSASCLSPRPTHGAAASAAASVTRTSSRARLRSGFMLLNYFLVPPSFGIAAQRASISHIPIHLGQLE